MNEFRIDVDPCPLGKFVVLINLPGYPDYFDTCDACKYNLSGGACSLMQDRLLKWGEPYYQGYSKPGVLFLGIEESI